MPEPKVTFSKTVWLKENIKFTLSVITLLSVLGGLLADVIPRPALAADLDRLTDSVQQMHDTYKQDTADHRVEHLQNQVANIELQFMIADKPISPEAQFYIKQKNQEIENIKEKLQQKAGYASIR